MTTSTERDNQAHCHCHHHHHGGSHANEECCVESGFLRIVRTFRLEIITSVIFGCSFLIPAHLQTFRLIAFIAALLPVGLPIFLNTLKEWRRGDIFNEFSLMVLACIGAFLIGEYPEGVAVLLFYSIGEKLEDLVSGDVEGSIKRLLGKMPKKATVVEGNDRVDMKPQEVTPGMVIAVKPGETTPLDGILISDGDYDFDTAAITGESMPRTFGKGATVMSGIIPVDREVLIRVTKAYSDSSMSHIMKMIEDASYNKAPTETVLRKITRWYTPLVFFAALLLFLIPMFIGLADSGYTFDWHVWLRRSLVFLVCACPCALIVSIPLTYFSAIGIASKKGILFKGHGFLDGIRRIRTMYFDKTGTITTGVFQVDGIKSYGKYTETDVLGIAASLERGNKHPLAEAVLKEAELKGAALKDVTGVRIIRHGVTGEYDGKTLIAGSPRLMNEKGIRIPGSGASGTAIYVSLDGECIGALTLSDTVKPGAKEAMDGLHRRGVTEIGILSGDNRDAVKRVAEAVGADSFRAELLPQDKQEIIKETEKSGTYTGFAGDGINDAPALALADVGIAMGTMGTDMAIESAGIVIAGDDLRKISEGIDISTRVKHVIIENVTFAFGVKILIMTLGAFGIATLWAAVFADTGVTVITILWTLFRLKIWQLKSPQQTA